MVMYKNHIMATGGHQIKSLESLTAAPHASLLSKGLVACAIIFFGTAVRLESAFHGHHYCRYHVQYHMLAIPGKSPASTKHSHLLTKCELCEVAIPQLTYSLHFDFNAISSCILAWNRLGEAWHRQ